MEIKFPEQVDNRTALQESRVRHRLKYGHKKERFTCSLEDTLGCLGIILAFLFYRYGPAFRNSNSARTDWVGYGLIQYALRRTGWPFLYEI